MFDSTIPRSFSNSPVLLEKVNMLFLSRETTEKDRSLKTKMLLAFDTSEKEKQGEIIWTEMGFFSDQRADIFNIKGLIFSIF